MQFQEWLLIHTMFQTHLQDCETRINGSQRGNSERDLCNKKGLRNGINTEGGKVTRLAKDNSVSYTCPSSYIHFKSHVPTGVINDYSETSINQFTGLHIEFFSGVRASTVYKQLRES